MSSILLSFAINISKFTRFFKTEISGMLASDNPSNLSLVKLAIAEISLILSSPIFLAKSNDSKFVKFLTASIFFIWLCDKKRCFKLVKPSTGEISIISLCDNLNSSRFFNPLNGDISLSAPLESSGFPEIVNCFKLTAFSSPTILLIC